MINVIPIESLPMFPEPTLLRYSMSFGGFCKPRIDGPNNFSWERGQLFYKIYRDHQEEDAVPLFLYEPEDLLRNSFSPPKMNPEYGKNRKSVVPAANLWNELWKVCDEIDIWSWPRDMQMSVTDVAEWHVELVSGSRSVFAKGYWLEPLQRHLPDYPRDIKSKVLRFHLALQALTGWSEQSK